VPNTEPKPAAMPHISSTGRSSRASLKARASWSASAPPICTAVPSRPTEAPNRCEMTVASSTSGAMRSGSAWRGWWISSISRLLPPSERPPSLR
jgi:hypothetical protein